MIKALIVSIALFLACTSYADTEVFDGEEFIGQVWTDKDSWKNCEDEPDQSACIAHDPIVCMEYSNDAIVPITCKLTVSALLAEPFTGFTKKVTDIRDEIVFYNQCHEVCFNFGKDRYKAWFLIDISEPIIECKRWDASAEI